jgi:DNA-binding SARP family transcriptional activator
MQTGARAPVRSSAQARSADPEALELDAFRGFPYGMLVVDDRGRVLCRNRAAARLIEGFGLGEGELTCCRLFGCHKPGTVLAPGCLTEFALAHEGVLPEVRVEIQTAEGPVAMWVAAGPIDRGDGEGPRIGVQLRPGQTSDRRQRTALHWMSGPRLRVCTLGKTVVESPEGPIDGAWLEQRTGQILKYLVAMRHRSVAVDEIGESIWPGADYAIGASVRYYIHSLRRRLEPQRGSREPSVFIAVGPGSYRLKLDHVVIDADEFEAEVTAGVARAEQDPQGAAVQIERGMAFYSGDFLADLPYAEWAMSERQHLHDLACMGLGCLAGIRIELGLFAAAAHALERLAAMQPYDEAVHRRLMELDIMQGRRSDAVRRYALLRSRLRRTFGHDPEFTPADLAHPRPHPTDVDRSG